MDERDDDDGKKNIKVSFIIVIKIA